MKNISHRTQGNNPKLIYESKEGFDMRFSERGKWGTANYFAQNGSYSNRYAHMAHAGQYRSQANIFSGSPHQIQLQFSTKLRAANAATYATRIRYSSSALYTAKVRYSDRSNRWFRSLHDMINMTMTSLILATLLNTL